MEGMKECGRCLVSKANTPVFFHRDKYMADGLTSACKVCRQRVSRGHATAKREADRPAYNEMMDKYRKANPEKIKRTTRKTHVKITYGITMEQYELMLQDDCPICMEPMLRPCIDHNHKTGAVRGVICVRCNGGLGMLGDDAETLWRAMHYLRINQTGNAKLQA